MSLDTRQLKQVGPEHYEMPVGDSGLAIKRDHGERNVAHLTQQTMKGRDDALDWVMKFHEHRKARETVGGHVQAMQHLHKLTGSDMDAAERALLPVAGAQNMVTKGFIPAGVWGLILHFDPLILREGRIDEVLVARPEWCAPWYKPSRRKRWRLHGLLPESRSKARPSSPSLIS
jgi:hypothetical protein